MIRRWLFKIGVGVRERERERERVEREGERGGKVEIEGYRGRQRE